MIVTLLSITGLAIILILPDGENDEDIDLLYEIEDAYEYTIITKDISKMYPYATIPLAINISNKLRYEMDVSSALSFKEAEVTFTEQKDLETEHAIVYKRQITFNRVKGELYSYGMPSTELWYLDKVSMKLKRIETLKGDV